MHDPIVCLSLRPLGVDLLRHRPMPHHVARVATRLRALHVLQLRLREHVALQRNCQRRGAYHALHVRARHALVLRVAFECPICIFFKAAVGLTCTE